MKRGPTLYILIILVAIVAASLRLPLLSLRPMHTDEAVHAVKLGQLLTTGRYIYNPYEYHGPTLNALTLPVALLRGQHRLAQLDEVTLRLVPALFGLGVVLLPLLWAGGVRWGVILLAMTFTALSPAMVFYSRYYIQEMLLVCFTAGLMGCLWRFAHGRRIAWLVGAGICAGLMQATKETCVIAWGCMILAWIIVRWIERPIGLDHGWRPVLGGLLVAFVTSALLMSWFGTHPRGIWDALRSYTVYFNRAGHGAHIHPWYYYLDLLTWTEGMEWPGWNEDFVLVVGAIGFFYAIFKRRWRGCHLLLVRWLALYTFFMWVVYSMIPYKTPWSILGAWQGTLLLAALGMAELLRSAVHRWEKIFFWIFLGFFGLASPWAQAVLQNNVFYDDPGNPYVYAQTRRDIYTVLNQVNKVAAVHPAGRNLYIEVVCPHDDYWPLPWYLRDFTRVGYWNTVDVNQPAGDVILTQPAEMEAVQQQIYEGPQTQTRELYVPLLESPTWLRPGVELIGLVRYSLWQKLTLAATQEPNVP